MQAVDRWRTETAVWSAIARGRARAPSTWWCCAQSPARSPRSWCRSRRRAGGCRCCSAAPAGPSSYPAPRRDTHEQLYLLSFFPFLSLFICFLCYNSDRWSMQLEDRMRRPRGLLRRSGQAARWALQARAWPHRCARTPPRDRAARLDPGLVVQVRDVELLARRVRQQLVVLLQDLVEALRGGGGAGSGRQSGLPCKHAGWHSLLSVHEF